MKRHQPWAASGVVVVLLAGWLGFLFHRAPRFAGSTTGTFFGIAAAILMLIPLTYSLVKRVPYLHDRVTAVVPLQSILTFHIWVGLLAALLAIVHTGHKFDSWLGIALTAVMLLIVVSGFIVAYLLNYVGQEMRDKNLLLLTARGDLDSAWGARSKPVGGELSQPSEKCIEIAKSVSDLEFAIRTNEVFKFWFGWSLKIHIVLSFVFYGLLAVHIWSGVHFGLRWFR